MENFECSHFSLQKLAESRLKQVCLYFPLKRHVLMYSSGKSCTRFHLIEPSVFVSLEDSIFYHFQVHSHLVLFSIPKVREIFLFFKSEIPFRLLQNCLNQVKRICRTKRFFFFVSQGRNNFSSSPSRVFRFICWCASPSSGKYDPRPANSNYPNSIKTAFVMPAPPSQSTPGIYFRIHSFITKITKAWLKYTLYISCSHYCAIVHPQRNYHNGEIIFAESILNLLRSDVIFIVIIIVLMCSSVYVVPAAYHSYS